MPDAKPTDIEGRLKAAIYKALWNVAWDELDMSGGFAEFSKASNGLYDEVRVLARDAAALLRKVKE